MEIDVDTNKSTDIVSKRVNIEPLLRSAPTVAAGRLTCIVCFESCARNRRKSKEMQELKDGLNTIMNIILSFQRLIGCQNHSTFIRIVDPYFSKNLLCHVNKKKLQNTQ